MANENNFKETVNSLFKGMDSFISAKTVVGEAIHVGDTIILPLMDVSFGVGAGAFSGEKKDNGGGGMAGKMTPCAVLVIQNGTTKLVNVKNQDGLTILSPEKVTKNLSANQKNNFCIDYSKPMKKVQKNWKSCSALCCFS